jgi:hypothetical protein
LASLDFHIRSSAGALQFGRLNQVCADVVAYEIFVRQLRNRLGELRGVMKFRRLITESPSSTDATRQKYFVL